PPSSTPFPYTTLFRSDTLAEIQRDLAETIASAGLSVEISTAGLRKPVGELYPDRDLLRACTSLGVTVTLASDAHEPRLVGKDFEDRKSTRLNSSHVAI